MICKMEEVLSYGVMAAIIMENIRMDRNVVKASIIGQTVQSMRDSGSLMK